jgi:hypothetical protein
MSRRMRQRITTACEFASRRALPAAAAENSLPPAQTGYYGRIDESGRIRTTKVHVHIAGESKPACGVHLHPQMAFHFCSSGLTTYVECERCQHVASLLTAA